MLYRLLFIAFIFPAVVFAQNNDGGNSYKIGIGVRAGYHPGGTLKYFISDDKALEGILQFRYSGFSATGLIEKHAIAFDEPQLRWFYGIGAHFGFYGRPSYAAKKRGYYYYESRPSFGVDGMLGLEYVIKEVPFTVGVDFKPYIDIYYPGFGMFDAALSVRYIF